MERNELQDGITVFRHVMTEHGTLSAVFLGPGGAFLCAETFPAPDESYVLFKNLFRVSRLLLYSETQGVYDPLSGRFTPLQTDEQPEARALAFVGFRGCLHCYTPEDLSVMCQRLERADAYARGWYRSASGSLYLRYGDVFREASDKDPEQTYYLVLFGGVLGLHRFYLGKIFSGLVYLFTGGLCGLGWVIDLVFLLLGAQKDGHKRILLPLRHRLRKCLLLPVGFPVSCLILAALAALYRSLLSGSIHPFS